MSPDMGTRRRGLPSLLCSVNSHTFKQSQNPEINGRSSRAVIDGTAGFVWDRMTYIRNGEVVHGPRPWLRLSIIPELFWGIANFVYFLFATLFSVRAAHTRAHRPRVDVSARPSFLLSGPAF